jgi:hypothetical protein
MNSVLWIHEDMLNPKAALWQRPHAGAVYVFDEEHLRDAGYALKRLLFIYESLLELPVSIRKGNTVEIVSSFAAERGAEHILTSASVQPWIRRAVERLRACWSVEVIPEAPFLQCPEPSDLTRFARFWREVEPYAFGREPRLKAHRETAAAARPATETRTTTRSRRPRR